MIAANLPVFLPVDIQKLIIEKGDPDLSQFGLWRSTFFRSAFDQLTTARFNNLRNFALKNTPLDPSERASLVRAFRPIPNDEQWKQLAQKINLFMNEKSSDEQINARKRAVLLYSLSRAHKMSDEGNDSVPYLPSDENDISKILENGFIGAIGKSFFDIRALCSPDDIKEIASMMIITIRSFIDRGVSADAPLFPPTFVDYTTERLAFFKALNLMVSNRKISAIEMFGWLNLSVHQNRLSPVERGQQEMIEGIFSAMLSTSKLLPYHRDNSYSWRKQDLILKEYERRLVDQRMKMIVQKIWKPLIGITPNCIKTAAGVAFSANLNLVKFWTELLPEISNVNPQLKDFLKSISIQSLCHILLLGIQVNSLYYRPLATLTTHIGWTLLISLVATVVVAEDALASRDPTTNRRAHNMYFPFTAGYIAALAFLISI